MNPPWKDVIRAAYDAGVSTEALTEELGVDLRTQARWAAGERQPREGTQRLMRSAINVLVARASPGGAP